MERAVEFIEPDGDLVKLNEMQKEEIAEFDPSCSEKERDREEKCW